MSALTAASDTHRSPVTAQVTDAAFAAEAGRIRQVVADQVILTQGRCVDHLLDLLNLTTEPSVQAELTGFLSDIRKQSAVEGARMRQVLDVVVAAVEVESAYARFVLS
jgi:hypothetical protein